MTGALSCRSCGHATLQPVLDLGLQPLANNLLLPEHLGQAEPRFPLRLLVCPRCWLVQIGELVPPVKLFSEYLYFSSFSDAMLRHARIACERYRVEQGLGAHSRVVEIASNDGYLLRNFVQAGIPCLGIEPAANVAQAAVAQGVPTRVEFFGEKSATTLVEEGLAADLILGNNVFAHAPFINDFVSGLKRLLKPDGQVILEFPYALDFLENREFDTIYHEHVFYFSLIPLLPLLDRHGLEIFHVERLPIHGGSLRLFAGHRGVRPVKPSVADRLQDETSRGLASARPYEQFAHRVQELKEEVVAELRRLKREGKRLAAYGASAKGSTLLNYFGIGAEELDYVVDRSTYKQGRLTPGTHLPILPTEQLLVRKPDYTLLLTWNFADEILAQQSAYRSAGGKFLIPVPELRTV
ncbi:MAG: methyltransferase domain-containing protein [Verrucomicrobiales bacterium]|nr:methyltransferase domain-containing protein [Verrucomicrobiales bacterium]